MSNYDAMPKLIFFFENGMLTIPVKIVIAVKGHGLTGLDLYHAFDTRKLIKP